MSERLARRRAAPSAFAMPIAERRRLGLAGLAFLAVFGTLAGRFAVLANGENRPVAAPIQSVARALARPDIVDRNGQLLATDLAAPSVFADPEHVLDVDETAEQLAEVLPGLDAKSLRFDLSNKKRNFLWIRRGLTPEEERRVLELGLPGIGFRREPRRVYPIGQNAAHVLGFVDIENRGVTGIERWIDQMGRSELVDGPVRSNLPPVALSIDLAVQHALRRELTTAITDYSAEAAAGIVMDARTGAVLAASSLPDYLTGDAAASLAPAVADRVAGGTYELGSVFKTFALAIGHEAGLFTPGKTYDARTPIRIGGETIDDLHPERRALTPLEVFLHSSNIGAAKIATEAGEVRVRSMLARLGLTEPLTTELGQGPRPQLPGEWRPVSTMTISYGHGIAVSPLQFTAAFATLVNGGMRVTPTFLAPGSGGAAAPEAVPVVAEETAGFIRELLLRNATDAAGTGRRASVEGYAVGGKTGTADILGAKGYQGAGVLTSFIAAFPAHRPRYVTYILLWKPKPTPAASGLTTAGANAAPVTGRLIARIAPQLGLAPALP